MSVLHRSRLFNTVSSIFLVCLLLTSQSVYAAFTDITGPWTGSLSGVDSGCTPGTLNGPFSDQVSAVFSNENLTTGTFNVTVTTVEQDGSVSTDTGSGSFLTATQIQFTLTSSGGGGIDTTTVTGDLVGNTINFNFSGSNSGGDGCIYSGSGSISRSGADVVLNPAETPSSTVTEAVLFNTQIQGTVTGVSSHIGGALSGVRSRGAPRVVDNKFILEGALGLNAGDGLAIPYGIWGNYSYTDYENDFSATAFDGTNHSFLGGIDFSFWDNTVTGVAFGYDNGSIDTTFNAGHQDTDTYTLAPYFGALLSDTWSVDATAGFSRVKYDQFRTAGVTRVTSTPESDRYFAALNLNGVTYYNNWIIGGRIGYLWARNKLETYTESNGAVVGKSTTKVGTWSVGGDVAYSMQNYEPFVGLTYSHDYSFTKIAIVGTGPQPANDRDDVLLRLGVRYFNTDRISGNLEYTTRLSREDFSEDRIGMTLRADF